MHFPVNNDDNGVDLELAAGNAGQYIGLLSGNKADVTNGSIHVNLKGNSGDIFVPVTADVKMEPVKLEVPDKKKEPVVMEETIQNPEPKDIAFREEISVAESKEPEPVENITDQLVRKDTYMDCHETQGKAYEDMTIVELQEAILYKMSKNGPITDQMYKTVEENVYPDSLVNWVKSFS